MAGGGREEVRKWRARRVEEGRQWRGRGEEEWSCSVLRFVVFSYDVIDASQQQLLLRKRHVVYERLEVLIRM